MFRVERKICRKCKQSKLLSDFSNDKHFRDGLRSVCKKCSVPRFKTRKGKHCLMMLRSKKIHC